MTYDPAMRHRSEGAAADGSLRLYAALSRLPRLGYGGKIMLVAFLGTHVPLLGIIAFLAVANAPEAGYPWGLVVAALGATLVGAGATLVALHHLLRPVTLVSRGLRAYATHRALPELPSGYTDAAGTLMADAGDALHRLDETLDRLVHRDPVTGLPNRAGFLRALEGRAASAGAAPFSVCALGLERFDDVVSAFGQARSDRVLRLAVQRIASSLGHRVELSRIGAHAFACLLGRADVETATRAFDALDRDLKEFGHDGVDVGLGCRAGIALCPRDGTDPETLLDGATSALDDATRTGRRLAVFSRAGREALAGRYALERDLSRALDGEAGDEIGAGVGSGVGGEGGLALHYQPVVDADGGTVVGVEALVRWHHPSFGMLAPAAFIPLAERSALIERLGRWTLATACRQLGLWRGTGLSGLKVAVNLSARQFLDPALPDYLAALLTEHRIEPGRLELELTETSAMSDVESTGAVMARARALGVSIAIDDFGTGYSSMSHLRTMPFDRLKIDREFVQDVATNTDHRAICGALIALARELKLEVLAEGTETSSEVETLRKQGCRVFQGFYFHRPMPAAAVEALVTGGRVPLALA